MQTAFRFAVSGILLPLLFGIILVLSHCEKQGAADRPDQTSRLVLGKVAGKEFTVGDLQRKLKYQFGTQIEGVTGAQAVQQHREILDTALDELCWVTLGEKLGYAKDPAFKETMELSRKYILARTTVDNEVRAKSDPTEEEIWSHYESNQKDYTVPARVKVAHVLVASKREAEAVRQRLLRGEPLAQVARSVSIDEMTKNAAGEIGWVTAVSSTGHMGRVAEMNAAAMQLQTGEISPPVEIADGRGWSVIVALDRAEQTLRPLDDTLHESIRRALQTKKHNELYRNLIGQLKAEYGFELYEENYTRYAATLMSEDDLFTAAQREKTPQRKIDSYRGIIEAYPDGRYAPQARFMVGFVLADELNDHEGARKEFERFLREYPNHELVESARWMVDNMEKPNPDVEQLQEVRRKARSRN